MSSWAEVAARGPHQSPEEARAPPVAEIEHTHDTHETVDVDSPHISSVSSDFKSQEIKTDTQRERLEHEAADKARQAEQEVARAAEQAKAKAKKAAEVVKKNPENPVIFGNAVVLAALGIALGVDGYRRYQRGTFGWATAGAWAGIIGVFAVGDYVVSRLGLQKYPPKE